MSTAGIHKGPATSTITITPQPTTAEVAAILAAYEALLHPTADEPPTPSAPRWRFSGRWWNSTRYQRSPRQR